MTNQGETESRPGLLVCEECGVTSLDGRSWRALIVEELADEEADVWRPVNGLVDASHSCDDVWHR